MPEPLTPGDDDELAEGQVEIYVLEVVLARAADVDMTRPGGTAPVAWLLDLAASLGHGNSDRPNPPILRTCAAFICAERLSAAIESGQSRGASQCRSSKAAIDGASMAGQLFHVIDTHGFDRPLLDELCALTTRVRGTRQDGRRRTGSAAARAPRRGPCCIFRSPPRARSCPSTTPATCSASAPARSAIPATSSEVKGESFDDSIRTFSSYVDVIVMRTPGAGLRRARRRS